MNTIVSVIVGVLVTTCLCPHVTGPKLFAAAFAVTFVTRAILDATFKEDKQGGCQK